MKSNLNCLNLFTIFAFNIFATNINPNGSGYEKFYSSNEKMTVWLESIRVLMGECQFELRIIFLTILYRFQ